jgi:DNA-binding MarR family transcriptional regulator
MARPTAESYAAPVEQGAGYALFRLVRVLSRQSSPAADRLTHVLVVQGIGRPESPDDEVTVGRVADWLRVDPSVASRMVSQTLQAGYAVRVPSQGDGRRIALRLTPTGEALLSRTVEYQQEVFDSLISGWPARDKQDFTRLLIKFAEAVDQVSLSDGRPGRE